MTMDVFGTAARLLDAGHSPSELLQRMKPETRRALAREALKDLLTEPGLFALGVTALAANCCHGEHAIETLEVLETKDREEAYAIVLALGALRGSRTPPPCPAPEPVPYMHPTPEAAAEADLAAQQAAISMLSSTLSPVGAQPSGLRSPLGLIGAVLGAAVVRAVLPAALRRGLAASDLTDPANTVPAPPSSDS